MSYDEKQFKNLEQEPKQRKIPIALTIAGSDSSGGAGIQADLKTFCAMGVYSSSVITALTAQNTMGVEQVVQVHEQFVTRQCEVVCEDLEVDAIKIGMLSNAQIIEEVADFLESYGCNQIVLDPVMIAQSGDKLLEDKALEVLVKRLVPLATVVTPNLPEAFLITEQIVAQKDKDNRNIHASPHDPTIEGEDDRTSIDQISCDINFEEDLEEIKAMAQHMIEHGANSVLIKGGHAQSNLATDLFMTSDMQTVMLESPIVPTNNNHGTGCTLSSAIASGLAKGKDLMEAIKDAKAFLDGAIESAKDIKIGRGHGPVNHSWQNNNITYK